MPSPKDAERFLGSETGLSKDELLESLREGLRDFHLSLPGPGPKVSGVPQAMPVIEEGAAGFDLPRRGIVGQAHAAPASDTPGGEITLHCVFNGGIAEVAFPGAYLV